MSTTFVGPSVDALAAQKTRASRAALEGARDITPMVIGVIPLAIAIGAAIGTSSISIPQGIVSAPAILAGAAQLTTIEMLDDGAAAPIIILSGLIINARIVLYGASIAPWFRDEPLTWRLLLAIPVIDQLYFTCIPRFERGDLDRGERRAYYLGAASWLFGAWIATQSIAIATSGYLPEALDLDVAAPLALAGLLARSTTDRRTVTSAALAAPIAAFGIGLPFHSSVLVAIIIGIAVASFLPASEDDS